MISEKSKADAFNLGPAVRNFVRAVSEGGASSGGESGETDKSGGVRHEESESPSSPQGALHALTRQNKIDAEGLLNEFVTYMTSIYTGRSARINMMADSKLRIAIAKVASYARYVMMSFSTAGGAALGSEAAYTLSLTTIGGGAYGTALKVLAFALPTLAGIMTGLAMTRRSDRELMIAQTKQRVRDAIESADSDSGANGGGDLKNRLANAVEGRVGYVPEGRAFKRAVNALSALRGGYGSDSDLRVRLAQSVSALTRGNTPNLEPMDAIMREFRPSVLGRALRSIVAVSSGLAGGVGLAAFHIGTDTSIFNQAGLVIDTLTGGVGSAAGNATNRGIGALLNLFK